MYHLSPKTGEPLDCRATVKSCPYGPEVHFRTKTEARKSYEESMGGELTKKINADKDFKSHAKKGVFLGRYETLEDVIAMDTETMEKLGETFEEIGSRMEKINQWTINACVGRPARPKEVWTFPKEIQKSLNSFGLKDKDTLAYSPSFIMGSQECPFKNCSEKQVRSSHTIEIHRSERVLKINGLTGHLIKNHHFFQGEGSPYRVAPQQIHDFFKKD